MKTSPIYLDRLEKALGAQGIKLKRSQLLETAAAAFGYHNSNEFSAAAKRGDLTPPTVTPLGRITLPDGQSVLIVSDTLANSAYGIDEAFIEQVVEEERAEQIGVTPYGHLAFLGDLAAQTVPDLATAAPSAPADDGTTLAQIARDIEALAAIDMDDLPLALEALSDLRGLAQELRSKSANQIVPSPAHPLDTTNVVAIGRHTLEWLVDASQRFAGDVDSGFGNGVAHDDGADVGEIERAIDIARARLDAPRAPEPVQQRGAKTVLTLHTATVDHKHGTNSYAELSDEALDRALADYCSECWHEVGGRKGVPAEPTGMDDQEIISTYFEAHDVEFLNRGQADLEVSPAVLAQIAGAVAPPQPLIVNGIELPAGDWLKDIATTLRDGATADIWFDAHEFPGEEGAANTICEAQRAMSEAADIFDKIVEASKAPTAKPSRPAPLATAPEVRPGIDTPVWITDSEGDDTHSVSIGLLKNLGLKYTEEGGSFDFPLPLTEDEYQVVRDRSTLQSRYEQGYSITLGTSVLHKGRKFHAPSIAIRWGADADGATIEQADAELDRIVAAIEPLVIMIGGEILVDREATDETHEINVLVPFEVAQAATNVEAYFDALDFLINGQAIEGTPRVMAHFIPQAWQNDHIITCDDEGNDTYDVTFEILMLGEDLAQSINDKGDVDDLKDAFNAPLWVSRWSGPFDIEVGDAAREFFETRNGTTTGGRKAACLAFTERPAEALPSKGQMSIAAETHSDDHAVEVDFDAVRWFEQASDDEILALAECGWGGDYPADNVASFFEGAHGEITEMFQHIGHMQKTRNAVGFECHVDEDEAMAWLDANKPELAATIREREED